MIRGPVLALVPARGGSRGIIGKNLARIDGSPMLSITLSTLVSVPQIDRLVVSTDDPAIAAVASRHGAEIHHRRTELSGDAVTLGALALAVIDELGFDGVVGLFQPTSPLRTAESVANALETFDESDADSLASVVRETSLFWWDGEDDLTRVKPLFSERVNRQFARHRVLRETGSIQLVTSASLRSNGELVGEVHHVFETAPDESIDVNSNDDLAAARRRFDRGSVVMRIRANRQIGYGHLFHALTVAEELQHHEVRFLLTGCDDEVSRILEARGWPWTVETDLAAYLDCIDPLRPRVLVNDVLDTDVADVLPATQRGFRVVNIEDLGSGARHADLVVNALYPAGGVPEALTGAAYTTLRPEFMGLPTRALRPSVSRVLVTFGGADPANLSARFGSALVRGLDCDVRIVQGPAARPIDVPGATVVRSTASMASEMLAADIVVTSAGRTVYEAAATGTPVVVVAQNSREATHSHLSMEQGVLYLGIGALTDDDHLLSVVRRLAEDIDLRQDLSSRLLAAVDTRGAERIVHNIEAMLRGLR